MFYNRIDMMTGHKHTFFLVQTVLDEILYPARFFSCGFLKKKKKKSQVVVEATTTAVSARSFPSGNAHDPRKTKLGSGIVASRGRGIRCSSSWYCIV